TSLLISAIAIFTPTEAIAFTMAAPITPAPPVITHTLPLRSLKLIGFIILFVSLLLIVQIFFCNDIDGGIIFSTDRFLQYNMVEKGNYSIVALVFGALADQKINRSLFQVFNVLADQIVAYHPNTGSSGLFEKFSQVIHLGVGDENSFHRMIGIQC